MIGAATAACVGGSTGSAPEREPATSEPSDWPLIAGEPTGYRGALAVGLDRDLSPRSTGARSFVVTVRLQLGPPSCEGPSDSSCPAREDAAVDFSISALLDYRQVLEVAPRTHRLTATSAETLELEMAVPRLAPGRHCVLVALTEDPVVAAANELPSHGAALLYEVEVGSSAVDHCDARDAQGPEPDVAPVWQGSCADPVLSTKRRQVYVDRDVPPISPLWLFSPPCDHGRLVAFVVDGVLAGVNETHDPLEVPARERSMMTELSRMESDTLQAVVARRPQNGRTQAVVLVQPVAVVP